jgi:DNA-binding SARP family transcriptional activator
MASALRFAVLGPVRAWRGDTELDLGSPQQRAVLAVLLLAEGRQVPLAVLIAALWESDPPPASVGTVRTYVSRLRRCLADPEDRGLYDRIESAGDGYALSLRSALLDLDLFRQWTRDAQAARSGGRKNHPAAWPTATARVRLPPRRSPSSSAGRATSRRSSGS